MGMMFNRDMIEKILSGKKTSTIRSKIQYETGDITNLMANKNFSKITGKNIEITRVYPIKLGKIDDAIAQKDGFKDVDELKN